MTSSLATKQDLQHLQQLMNARFEALEARFEGFEARFDGMDGRFTLMNQNLESRIVFKLGALMVVLFGLAGTLMKVLG